MGVVYVCVEGFEGLAQDHVRSYPSVSVVLRKPHLFVDHHQ